MRDYYEILGVQKGCDDAALKSAFRKQAMEHHPDRNGGCENAEGRFKEINEAYSILSDPQKRAAYDRFGHAGVNGNGGGGGGFGGFGGAGGPDVSDIFSQMFGDIFGAQQQGGGRQSGPARGNDLRYDLEISLEQAYAGEEVEITIHAAMTCDSCEGDGCAPGSSPTTCGTCGGAGAVRTTQGFFSMQRACPRCGGAGQLVLDPCRTCRGHGMVKRPRTLSVRIPAGVDDGARIRLAGEGDAGARGGPRGDLYIFLSVAPHDLFERDHLDLHCTVPVRMCTAALGGEIDAPCLGPEGKISVKIPEGAQTGRTVRLRGKGMPALRGRDRGDLVVQLFVETPTHLTARQKELMRELAGSCGDAQHPESKGFGDKAKKFWEGLTGT